MDVHHILNVTGFSSSSFDDAVKHAIHGAWHHHGHEFEEFVSYEVTNMEGDIRMDAGGPMPQYSVTLAISAIHKHDHDH